MAVSADGKLAVVGAPMASVGTAALQGAAYVFSSTTGNWALVAQLQPSDGTKYDRLGFAVAISADTKTVVVGAIQGVPANVQPKEPGKAYIFSEPSDGWSGTIDDAAVLTNPSVSPGGQFGGAVALTADGATVVVGAEYDNNYVGTASIFTQPSSGWGGQLTPSATLQGSPSAETPYGSFGWSVAMSVDGSIIAVGQPGVDAGVGAGKVLVFDRPDGGWTGSNSEESVLQARDGQDGDFFGHAVAMSADGSYCLVGAGATVGTNVTQGAAYLFTDGTAGWAQSSKLTASDGAADDWFGFSVALSLDGTVVAIGAPNRAVDGEVDEGTMYEFTEPFGGWGGNLTESQELIPANSPPYATFGYNVQVLTGDLLIGGAPALDAPMLSSASKSPDYRMRATVRPPSHTWSGSVSYGAAYLFAADTPAFAAQSVAPSDMGQSARGAPLQISGTGFVPSDRVAIAGKGVTVESVVVVSTTTITVLVNVSANALVGARDVAVSNGTSLAICRSCLRIDPAPTPTSANPVTLEDGATGVAIAILGQGFQPGAIRFAVTGPGPGVRVNGVSFVSSTQVDARISVAVGTVAGSFTLRMTNPDRGVGTCLGCVVIAAGPTVAGVTPSLVARGSTYAVTVTGNLFSAGASLKGPAGVRFSHVVVQDQTTISASMAVAATAAVGSNLTITVIDPLAAGSGRGSCACLSLT